MGSPREHLCQTPRDEGSFHSPPRKAEPRAAISILMCRWLVKQEKNGISRCAELLAGRVRGQRAPVVGIWALPRGTAMPPTLLHSPRPR